MRKILVIRGGALGDFILTLPVLSALRAHFPSHSIEILGDTRFASLAIAGGLADRAASLDSPALAGFFSRDGSKPPATAAYFSEFDIIISYIYDPDGIFQSNITHCSRARFIAGPHRPDESANIHATDQLLRPLEEHGIRDADPHPRLSLPLSDNAAIESNWVAMHPGSGSEQKNWPEAKWLELLQVLSRETPWNFLLIGGEAEDSRCERLAATLPPGRAEIAQNLPLVQLAKKMKSCAAFIGHDSGITHLAAALGVPGLALWGPTAEKTWRPKSERFQLLRDSQGLPHLPVNTVRDAVYAAVRMQQFRGDPD